MTSTELVTKNITTNDNTLVRHFAVLKDILYKNHDKNDAITTPLAVSVLRSLDMTRSIINEEAKNCDELHPELAVPLYHIANIIKDISEKRNIVVRNLMDILDASAMLCAVNIRFILESGLRDYDFALTLHPCRDKELIKKYNAYTRDKQSKLAIKMLSRVPSRHCLPKNYASIIDFANALHDFTTACQCNNTQAFVNAIKGEPGFWSSSMNTSASNLYRELKFHVKNLVLAPEPYIAPGTYSEKEVIMTAIQKLEKIAAINEYELIYPPDGATSEYDQIASYIQDLYEYTNANKAVFGKKPMYLWFNFYDACYYTKRLMHNVSDPDEYINKLCTVIANAKYHDTKYASTVIWDFARTAKNHLCTLEKLAEKHMIKGIPEKMILNESAYARQMLSRVMLISDVDLNSCIEILSNLISNNAFMIAVGYDNAREKNEILENLALTNPIPIGL